MRNAVVVGVLLAAVAVASGAAGYSARGAVEMQPGQAGAVELRPGQAADFRPSRWYCSNRRAYVRCSNGDARPYAELTTSRPGGITVKVYTLRDPQGGTLRRTYRRGQPVYIFTAF